jgi:hypothetical protein
MLNSHYKDMLQTLSAHNVEFVVVGAVALAAHGIPRATGDIDIWVNATSENAGRTYRALAAFGAPLGDLAKEELAIPGLVFQIGVAPLKIDILTKIEGVSFAEAWAEKVIVDFDGFPMPVLSKRLMIQNKRSCGRSKDLVDLEALEKIDSNSSSME